MSSPAEHTHRTLLCLLTCIATSQIDRIYIEQSSPAPICFSTLQSYTIDCSFPASFCRFESSEWRDVWIITKVWIDGLQIVEIFLWAVEHYQLASFVICAVRISNLCDCPVSDLFISYDLEIRGIRIWKTFFLNDWFRPLFRAWALWWSTKENSSHITSPHTSTWSTQSTRSDSDSRLWRRDEVLSTRHRLLFARLTSCMLSMKDHRLSFEKIFLALYHVLSLDWVERSSPRRLRQWQIWS